MTFFQMKCFLSLAKTQKMSETAAAMGLSLSTLSKYIHRMEDELSAPLFSKKLSRQMLTREGELIYPSIEYIVKQYDDQRTESYKYISGYESSINVVIGFHQSHIVQQLLAFMKKHPKIRVGITEGPVSNICTILESGAADVGIVYEQVIDKKYPLTIQLNNDHLCAIVSKNHPMAGCKTVSLSQLQGERFFLYRGDHLMYRYLLNVCITAGFVPKVEYSELRLSTLLLNVAAGNGVTLLSEKTVNMQNISGNVVLHLSENPLLTLCAVCTCEYPNKSLDKLVKFLLTAGQPSQS